VDILKGKIALITGAGQGVGQGIAYALASEGAKIAVSGRTLSKAEDTAAEIRRRGGIAQAFHCEVTSKDDLERHVREVVAAFGGVNILVNNAQLVPLGSLLEVTDAEFVDGFESGPLASLRLMRLCYPYLKGDGVVINLGTGAAYRQDSGRYGAYAAVKEAIRALSRAAACEWGADNIRVNTVVPFAMSKGLESRNPPPSCRPCRCAALATANTILAAPWSRSAVRIRATSPARPSLSTAARPIWAEANILRHCEERSDAAIQGR